MKKGKKESMGLLGSSTSKSLSEQNAEAYLTQQFSGNCNISCQNLVSGASITIDNSKITGNVGISQTCSANGNCLINSSQNALADLMLKAKNSSAAKAAFSVWELDPFNTDVSESESIQNIREAINQTNNEMCNISSLNNMNNVSILVENSSIDGNVGFSQTGSSNGTCTLNNNMSATAIGTGLANNSSTSGGSDIVTLLKYIVIAIAIVVVCMIVSFLLMSYLSKRNKSKTSKKIINARIKAGCPGGFSPVTDSKGKVVVDTNNYPVCPPYVPNPIMVSNQNLPVSNQNLPVSFHQSG